MNERKKIGSLFWIIITLIPILGLIWGIIDPHEFQKYQSIARDYIVIFGVFGPIIFIVIQALQVVFTPISHYTIGAIGGYLYGPYLGGVFNYIGRIIGHYLSFLIARRFGRKLLEKYVKDNVVEKYDKIFSGSVQNDGRVRIQSFILFLIYFLPFFPDDEISYLVGASKMPNRHFILANIFGHLGGSFSLAYIGSGINTRDIWFWFLFIITLAGFPIIWALLRLSKKKISLQKKD